MRILSIDGGGVRGVLAARVIARLEASCPFIGSVDLIAGTSVGSLIALALANGTTPQRIVDLLQQEAPLIFKARDWLDEMPYVGRLDELVRADFDNTHLRVVLERELGTTTALGSLRKKVLIPTFDLDNGGDPRHWKPKYLHNFDGPGNDKPVLAADAAMRSGAAPTYFPVFQGCVDGGVMDNNPAMSALAKAVKEERDGKHVLLSIGTGLSPRHIAGDDLDWGFKQWLEDSRLLAMLFDGMVGVPDYQCRQLLGSRYERVNPTLPDSIDLADVDRLDDLLAVADGLDLADVTAWLRIHWRQDSES